MRLRTDRTPLLPTREECPLWERRVRALKMFSNAWLCVGKLDVYVRRAGRLVGEQYVPTLDIASVSSADIGGGHFSKWLPLFEALAEASGHRIYVENVATERFRSFWVRLGYVRKIPPDSDAPNAWPCYISPPFKEDAHED